MKVFVDCFRPVAAEINALRIAAGHVLASRIYDISAEFNMDVFDSDNVDDSDVIVETEIGSSSK
jgi:hypothetical protein